MAAVEFFFFKQNTAYEMRISDWSSDVCASDLQSPICSSGPSRSLISHSCASTTDGAIASELPHMQPLIRRKPSCCAACASSSAVVRPRSVERRVGKECVSTCRSRWLTYTYNKKVDWNSTKNK